ncbi:hypothetical protein LZ30DRAFT_33312 [Colletotrichum cereale]|nr:hypothetical protein LZ30DRAFT_33312 [Colletotrichum cereale]
MRRRNKARHSGGANTGPCLPHRGSVELTAVGRRRYAVYLPLWCCSKDGSVHNRVLGLSPDGTESSPSFSQVRRVPSSLRALLYFLSDYLHCTNQPARPFAVEPRYDSRRSWPARGHQLVGTGAFSAFLDVDETVRTTTVVSSPESCVKSNPWKPSIFLIRELATREA